MLIILTMILLQQLLGLSWPVVEPLNKVLAIIFIVIAIIVLLETFGALGPHPAFIR